VAIVIDDVGRDLVPLRKFLALPLDLSFAVLPHAKYTQESLALIRERGREVMLHLPMAPVDAEKVTDEKIVLGRDGPLEAALEACLEQVPDAVGINNHMGSALSLSPFAADRILRGVGRRSLWFLDSRTIARSQFCQRAQPLGIRCLERDVFLDDPPLSSSVRWRLTAAVKIAQSRGWAVAIGHPFQSTLEVLRKLQRSTFRVVKLSQLVSLAT
jgi:polysaccharide deacetylase 2 family uncharacterized protein YibQ